MTPVDGLPVVRTARPVPWRGVVTLALALVWIWGLGSLGAIVLGLTARRRTTSELDCQLLRAGIILGGFGLAGTIVGLGLLAGASSSNG